MYKRREKCSTFILLGNAMYNTYMHSSELVARIRSKYVRY